VATDAPLLPHQLKRIAQRVDKIQNSFIIKYTAN